MRFAYTAAITLFLLGSIMNDTTMPVLAKTQAERNKEEAAKKKAKGDDGKDKKKDTRTHGRTRLDDDVLSEDDEDFEKPKKVYDNNEKEKWIYGTPGSPDYKKDMTEDEVAEMEIMWDYDYVMSIIRGII